MEQHGAEWVAGERGAASEARVSVGVHVRGWPGT